MLIVDDDLRDASLWCYLAGPVVKLFKDYLSLCLVNGVESPQLAIIFWSNRQTSRDHAAGLLLSPRSVPLSWRKWFTRCHWVVLLD